MALQNSSLLFDVALSCSMDAGSDSGGLIHSAFSQIQEKQRLRIVPENEI
jgi:hypothetical protein